MADKEKCKGLTTEKKPCRITARENGYCGRHQDQFQEETVPEDARAGAAEGDAGQGTAPGEPGPPAVAAAPTLPDIPKPERQVHLYPVTESIRTIEDLIEEAGGEITPAIEEALESLFEDFDVGAEMLLKRYTELGLLGKGARTEAQRIGARARGCESMAESLKKQLLHAMSFRNLRTLEVGTFAVTRAPSNRAVEIDNPGEVDAAFRTVFEFPSPLEGEDQNAYNARLVLEMSAMLTSPDRAKITAHHDEWVVYHTAQLEDEAIYIAAMNDHGKKSKESMARHLANQSMPEGLSMRYGQHLRIK